MLEGEYRADGRRADELRETRLEASISAYKHFNGSARVRHGLTEVVAFVEGPREVS